jgi:hypothetical protein
MAGSIRNQLNGSWLLRVYLGRDESGKIKHRSRTVQGSRRDAERELARMVTAQVDAPADLGGQRRRQTHVVESGDDRERCHRPVAAQRVGRPVPDDQPGRPPGTGFSPQRIILRTSSYCSSVTPSQSILSPLTSDLSVVGTHSPARREWDHGSLSGIAAIKVPVPDDRAHPGCGVARELADHDAADGPWPALMVPVQQVDHEPRAVFDDAGDVLRLGSRSPGWRPARN